MRSNVAKPGLPPGDRHADDTHDRRQVHVAAGARSSHPHVLLNVDAGVTVRVTVPVAEARRIRDDLTRALLELGADQ
jgi:hypothetical protein